MPKQEKSVSDAIFRQRVADRLSSTISILRAQAQLTQEELGERLGRARITVAQWEGAKRVPDLPECVLISVALGVPISTLVAALDDLAPMLGRKCKK